MSAATVRDECPWATALAVFLPLFGGTVLSSACVETRRSLGEDCLKDDDCLSGVCSQLFCAALPPTIDAALFADVTAGNDAVADAPDASGPDADAALVSEVVAGDEGVGDDTDQAADGTPGSPTDASADGDDSGD
jgi:hypothetical protein